MSIRGTQQSEGSFEKKLYTGIAKVKVIAINPTLKELNALGINFKTEMVYPGEGRCKVVIWTENSVMGKVPNTFWINNPAKSASGKDQYIDKYGKSQWVEKKEDLKPTYEVNGQTFTSIDIASARIAYGGEVDLINFILNWADVQKDKITKEPGECRLETMSKIVKGDVTELVQLFSSVSNNSVWVGFTVRDGQYQSFYSRTFDRGWAKEPKNIIKALDKETNHKDYPGVSPYSFQEYVGTGATVAQRTTAESLPF